jgi:nicotinamide-nucleotide amidase
MLCSIITIGDEILIGQTIDTNSAWLGERLNVMGLEMVNILTIRDDPKQITEALDKVGANIDLVIITGGLGPTNDDLTKQTLAKYFGSKLVMNYEILNKIEEFFADRGLPMLDVNRQQAMLPDKAKILSNNYGSAAGMWFEKSTTVFISLPGVPFEMKGIMSDFGFDEIKSHFSLPFIYNRTVLTWGTAESFLADKLEDWEQRLRDSGLKLAYLPSPGIVRLRITGAGESNGVQALVDSYADEVYQLLPGKVFGEGTDTMEKRVGELLKQNKLTLSTAESCTGGYLAHLITSIPGSSEYYKGTIISYSNDIKTDVLGVDASLIEKYGAVSEEVVAQMAENIRVKMNTDYGIATSGIAGPDGGTEEKPVGTVWVAVCSKNKTKTKLLHLGKHRINNIRISAIWVMGILIKEINNSLAHVD